MKSQCLGICYHVLLIVQVNCSFQRAFPGHRRSSSVTSTATQASRRAVFERWVATTATTSAAAVIALTDLSKAANADVDFSTIQDLLGPTNQQPQEYRPGGPRPMYLTEPTEEFKNNEQKSMEFKRKNLQIKKQLIDALDKLSTDPNNSTTLANDLDDIRRLVKSNGGLPEGITKDEVVKICRRRKSKKFWPTEVEVAYQDLLAEISYLQSPNTGRDTSFL